jgi:hypothetical protein
MHTQGSDSDEAAKPSKPRAIAACVSILEAKPAIRSTATTMGKLMILLRDDYKTKLGDAFTLQKFHDTFITLGPLPLPLVRRAMLGETSGALFN